MYLSVFNARRPLILVCRGPLMEIEIPPTIPLHHRPRRAHSLRRLPQFLERIGSTFSTRILSKDNLAQHEARTVSFRLSFLETHNTFLLQPVQNATTDASTENGVHWVASAATACSERAYSMTGLGMWLDLVQIARCELLLPILANRSKFCQFILQDDIQTQGLHFYNLRLYLESYRFLRLSSQAPFSRSCSPFTSALKCD